MRKRKTEKETMRLLYNKTGSRLYGHIQFYEHDSTNNKIPTKGKGSRPFVIGEYVPGIDRLRVFGSLEFLLTEIRRLIDEFIAYNQKWGHSRQEEADTSADFGYRCHVMDFVILTSTHTRNLIHIIKRVNQQEITKYDYENQPEGTIKLSELFDILIHNRYYYFDGGYIKDVFSEKTKNHSRLSNQFMGYGVALDDFINAVRDVIFDVTVGDVAQILRWKFKKLNSTSSTQDVVFFIQNVRSFSDLMKSKIPTKGYDFMMNLMFNDANLKWIPGQNDSIVQRVVFQSPNIAINDDLTKREFNISVRYADAARDPDVGRDRLQDHNVSVGYNIFFDKVNAAFGTDKLLSGSQKTVLTKKLGNDPIGA